MGKSLIIVESPAKTRTLKNFLGNRFDIRASMGHVRDLPKSDLGVDIENNFKPRYVTLRERRETLKELREAVKKADRVYLASDPDREGEAIAWHLTEELKLENPLRIEFNEITRSAVLNALQNPRPLDERRINAQQARRILDRLVGYKLSPLLWKKVKSRLSAGRVQSVAVRLICDREAEIEAFVPQEYWTITARLSRQEEEQIFEAKLLEHAGQKIEIPNSAKAQSILADLEGADFVVQAIKKRQQRRHPAPPFITSTLQQEASRKLAFSARRTMTVAQQLYEGVEVGEEGHIGLITYMRTDSTRIANEALEQVRTFIAQNYGQEYLPPEPRKYKSSSTAQGAHEAIRPTSVLRTPQSVKPYLTPDQYRLYALIWQRFVACQMASAVLDVTTVDIKAKDYLFRASGSIVRFPGFTVVYTESREEEGEEESRLPLPELSEGELLRLWELLPRQHFTEPPPRYTEASLVKALEEKGIGRPSTYATIISTIQERGYVVLEEKRFRPTELGRKVNELLVKWFPDILDVEFTARVEQELDDIEAGNEDWIKVLWGFYGPFAQELETALEQMERVKVEPVTTEVQCPNCGRPMVLRQSRFGTFLGCSGFPECRAVLPGPEQKVNVPCPVEGCGGELITRRSKKGRTFYGCSRYPNCTFTTWLKPTTESCPQCGYPLGERIVRGKVQGKECINPDCSTKREAERETQEEPLPEPIPTP